MLLDQVCGVRWFAIGDRLEDEPVLADEVAPERPMVGQLQARLLMGTAKARRTAVVSTITNWLPPSSAIPTW